MIDFGNTGFMIICTALVFFMTPGLAFFYGGMVSRKNVVNTMLSSFFILGLCSVMWILFGYSLAFGGNTGGIFGSLKHFALSGIHMNDVTGTIPTYVFVAFQMMFALITPALISGSIAGRMRFKAFFIFIALWSVVVYYPLAHMVWGQGGLLGEGWLHSLDFAGGNVVHISSGVTGLVLAIVLGKRHMFDRISYRIHNIPFVALGAAILWFGWFGFNAGSALAADGLAAHAFLTTNTSAAAALITWMLLDVIKQGRPTLIGAATGAVVGLISITPGAGFVPVWASLIIGAAGSVICFFTISLIKGKLKIDDSLDAFGCHGIGGIWGGIATGIFADPAVNALAKPGLIFGGLSQFGSQVLSIVITIGIAVVGSLICIAVTRLFTPLRVESYDEKVGLDKSEHGEEAYPSFTGLD